MIYTVLMEIYNGQMWPSFVAQPIAKSDEQIGFNAIHTTNKQISVSGMYNIYFRLFYFSSTWIIFFISYWSIRQSNINFDFRLSLIHVYASFVHMLINNQANWCIDLFHCFILFYCSTACLHILRRQFFFVSLIPSNAYIV